MILSRGTSRLGSANHIITTNYVDSFREEEFIMIFGWFTICPQSMGNQIVSAQ